MNATRLITLLFLAISAQAASASTIWLKDSNGQVCKNSASTTNAGGVIGLGSVDSNGAMTMTIDNPNTGTETRSPSTGDCANLPRTTAGTPLVFRGSVAPQIVPIHMKKPGTHGVLECLDQGNNFVGVQGTLNDVQNAGYSLVLAFSYTDGCGGSALPTFQRPVLINPSAKGATVFSGAYYIFNANSVPEPGSLYLLLAGAAGLTLLGLQRRRLEKQSKL
jgi:hypothetical protein